MVEPEFDVQASLDRMERHGTTSIFLINTVLSLILERRTPDELAAYDFSALRRVCYGAQPSSPAFYHRIQKEIGEAWGVELVNIYGLTEGGTTGIYLSDSDHAEALGRIGPYGISIGRNGFRDWVEWTVLREEDDAPAAPNEGRRALRQRPEHDGPLRRPARGDRPRPSATGGCTPVTLPSSTTPTSSSSSTATSR